MTTAQLKQTAQPIIGAALRGLDRNTSTRQALAAALQRECLNAAVSGDDARFVVSYGLAQCGYGGGR